LSRFLEEDIDQGFGPMIDGAVAAKRNQAKAAEAKMVRLVERIRWIAVGSASVATLFSLTAGVLLFSGIKKPIEALMRGTAQVGAGNLAYRIPVGGGGEFGFLARHFNRMTGEIEFQRNQLQGAQALLERKVAERTVELNRLNRELQEMDQNRREFFADISHELRTPLTVIRGEAEVTLRGPDRDAEEYKETLERIVELAVQQSKMVDDLLLLARSETANLQFEWDRLDLAELVASASEDIAVLAEDRNIAVTQDLPAKSVWVDGDRQRLRQVMFILGDNACRYSPAGGRIGISMTIEPSEARISITDQGLGIPAIELDAIFERYFRSSTVRKHGMEGTGLGLPMARSIVKTHGGDIRVVSTEGSGSTFTVILPLAPTPPAPLSEAALAPIEDQTSEWAFC
jgi:signal transduction histidine kinase